MADSVNENVLNDSNMSEVLGTSHVSRNNLNSFNVYKNFENFNQDVNGFGYIFFTKPDMNNNQTFPNEFFNSVEMNPIKSNFNGAGFMYPLTNYAQSFDLTDTVLKTDTYVQSVRGYKIVRATDYIDSMTEGTFSINYHEDSNLTLLKLHKYWVDYIHDVRFGDIKCNPNALGTRFRPGFLDYVSSVYYFKLAPDGFTIVYYAKYTGVIPTNVPYSTQNLQMGEVKTNNPSYSYAFSFKHDMEPWILQDFNEVAKNKELVTQRETTRPTLKNNWCTGVSVGKYYSQADDQFKYCLLMK